MQQGGTARLPQLGGGTQRDRGVSVAHHQRCRDGTPLGIHRVGARALVGARQAGHFKVRFHRPVHGEAFSLTASGEYRPGFGNRFGAVRRADLVPRLERSSYLPPCLTVKARQSCPVVTLLVDHQFAWRGRVPGIQGEAVTALGRSNAGDAPQQAGIGMAETQERITVRFCPFVETADRLVRQRSRRQFHRPSLHHPDAQARSYGHNANVCQG